MKKRCDLGDRHSAPGFERSQNDIFVKWSEFHCTVKDASAASEKLQ